MHMAKCLGCTVIATTSRATKAQGIRDIGADMVIEGQGTDFHRQVIAATKHAGADLVVDFLGGSYFDGNIRALRTGGKLICAGVLDGHSAVVDLPFLINRQISVLPLTLRMKSKEGKRSVAKRFFTQWGGLPYFESLRPLGHSVFPFESRSSALALMESCAHTGKIVISFASDIMSAAHSAPAVRPAL